MVSLIYHPALGRLHLTSITYAPISICSAPSLRPTAVDIYKRLPKLTLCEQFSNFQDHGGRRWTRKNLGGNDPGGNRAADPMLPDR